MSFKAPIVTKDTNINVSKAMVIEALNAKFPNLQIPITASLMSQTNPEISVTGFNVRWSDRSGGEI